jgi:hypothetical protein
MDKGNLLRRFYRLLRQAGVPRVRFHSLRVTSNSLLIEAGADPVETSARMGHTSTQMMTLDVYARQLTGSGHLAAMKDKALAHDCPANENSPELPRESVSVLSDVTYLGMKKARRLGLFSNLETRGFEPLNILLAKSLSTEICSAKKALTQRENPDGCRIFADIAVSQNVCVRSRSFVETVPKLVPMPLGSARRRADASELMRACCSSREMPPPVRIGHRRHRRKPTVRKAPPFFTRNGSSRRAPWRSDYHQRHP